MDRAARNVRARLTGRARLHTAIIVGSGLVAGSTVTGVLAAEAESDAPQSPSASSPTPVPSRRPVLKARRVPEPRAQSTRRPGVVRPSPTRAAAPDATSSAS
ncbi:exported hypothetical protein [Aeromicrobium sp. 9AM]|nr:exported hypothetical protein [Aeromicrobium sp. 9AM]